MPNTEKQAQDNDADRPGPDDAALPNLIDRGATTAPPITKRALRLIPVALGLVMTGAIVGLYFQPPLLQFIFRSLALEPGAGTTMPIATPAPASGASDKGTATGDSDRRYVLGLGKIIPSGDVVVVSPPFGAADARIALLKVKEGDRVTKGETLAIMDSEKQYRAAIESVRATVEAKDAVLAQTLASVRASRAEAGASLERAIATAKKAERDLDRIERLYAKGFATLAALDQKRTTRDETAREIERARAALSRWDTPDASRQPDVVVAHAISTRRKPISRARKTISTRLSCGRRSAARCSKFSPRSANVRAQPA